MPDIDHIRAQIERTRIQVHLQRGEIRQLQRVGIATTSAEALLDRMLNNIDGLCRARSAEKGGVQAVQGESVGRPSGLICASLPNGTTTVPTPPVD
jgi:hypothetical protein